MTEENNDKQKKYDVQFLSFVHGLSMSAMQHLGKIMNPVTQKIERNLDAARATIDLLEMLQSKTQGNLNEQEKNLLQEMLTNLRLNYVDEYEKAPETTETEQTQPEQTQADTPEPDTPEPETPEPETPEDEDEKEEKP